MRQYLILMVALALGSRATGATIDVPPDGDLFRAIGAARSGDVVILADGTFDVAFPIVIPDGVMIRSKSSPTYEFWRKADLDPLGEVPGTEDLYRLTCKTIIRSADGRYAFRVKRGSTVRFWGIGFDGSAVEMSERSDLMMEYCTATNWQRGPRDNGFGVPICIGNPKSWQPQHTKVSNCSFRDARGGWAIGYYRTDGYEQSDCEFVNLGNGGKSNNVGNTSAGQKICRNYYYGIDRMAEEQQGCVDGLVLEDNFYECPAFPGNWLDPNGHSPDDANSSMLTFSVIYHGLNNRGVTSVRRNTVVVKHLPTDDGAIVLSKQENPKRPDDIGVRQAFETGNRFEVCENLIVGTGVPWTCWMADSDPKKQAAFTRETCGTSLFANNLVRSMRRGDGQVHGREDLVNLATQENNGPDVKLSWNRMRGRPGPGRKFRDASGATTSTRPDSR